MKRFLKVLVIAIIIAFGSGFSSASSVAPIASENTMITSCTPALHHIRMQRKSHWDQHTEWSEWMVAPGANTEDYMYNFDTTVEFGRTQMYVSGCDPNFWLIKFQISYATNLSLILYEEDFSGIILLDYINPE